MAGLAKGLAGEVASHDAAGNKTNKAKRNHKGFPLRRQRALVAIAHH